MDKINLEIFFKEIGEKIVEAVKNDFPMMRKEFKKEKPYAVAFETDSDCITLSLIVNTYEFLKKTDPRYVKKGYSEAKWSPGEWGYSTDWKGSGLVEISAELSKKMSSISDQVANQVPDLIETLRKQAAAGEDTTQAWTQYVALIEEYRFTELFFETVTAAFLELIQTNVFGFDPDEVTYFISMSDDDRAEEIENNSAKVLNSEKVYEEFLKRFDGIED